MVVRREKVMTRLVRSVDEKKRSLPHLIDRFLGGTEKFYFMDAKVAPNSNIIKKVAENVPKIQGIR